MTEARRSVRRAWGYVTSGLPEDVREQRWDFEFPDKKEERVVDECSLGFAVVEPLVEPLEQPPVETHRSGTCFEVESTEMREACVEPIREYLGADVVVHEVRHQRSAYHTDLVYAVVDPAKVMERFHLVVSTEPIHDPLQRFRVWWNVMEWGPIPRPDAVEDGCYADPSKNRKHIDWLLNNGYLARSTTDHLVAVTPPEICELHAVELKLRNWERALEQADRANRSDLGDWVPRYRHDRYGYADYCWVALDAGAIDNALPNLGAFREKGVGLLAVAEGGTVVEHLVADHEPRGRYTRDRAYVESQVWNRIDLDRFIEQARDSDEDDDVPTEDNTSQPSLTAFDGGEPE